MTDNWQPTEKAGKKRRLILEAFKEMDYPKAYHGLFSDIQRWVWGTYKVKISVDYIKEVLEGMGQRD